MIFTAMAIIKRTSEEPICMREWVVFRQYGRQSYIVTHFIGVHAKSSRHKTALANPLFSWET